MVSMNKRRFVAKEQKLDLDLTYICDRLIAMALPCVRDALYRNDMQVTTPTFKLYEGPLYRIPLAFSRY